MNDVKISELPAGTADPNAIVPATNAAGTATEKLTLGDIVALATATGDPAVANTGNVEAIRRLTQAEYDAIATPDANTLYVITE